MVGAKQLLLVKKKKHLRFKSNCSWLCTDCINFCTILISYINTYMWNLEKWCRWSYLQSRNRDRQIENKCMFKKGEKEVWDEFGDWDWHIYIFRMRRQSSHSIRKPLYSPRSIHATHEIQKLLCWFCYSPQGLHPLSHHLILCKGVPLVFNEGSLH